MLSQSIGAPSFFVLRRISLCKCTIVFSSIHFTDGHLGCFQHLAIANCAAMNIGVHRFFWIGVSGLLANINKATNKCWRGCGEKGTLVHCWWECRLVQPLWKTVWNCLRKLKMELPFDPAILLLGPYRKIPETPIQKNLCTPMFIAEQFTKVKC